MIILTKLWGIVLTGAGAYCTYEMVNTLFLKGKISEFPLFLIVIFLVGLLLGITCIFLGIRMIKMKGR